MERSFQLTPVLVLSLPQAALAKPGRQLLSFPLTLVAIALLSDQASLRVLLVRGRPRGHLRVGVQPEGARQATHPVSPWSPALADFDEPQRSTFVMLGVLTIAVRTYHDRWGYGVYSGPIGMAVLVIAAKWVCTACASAEGTRGSP